MVSKRKNEVKFWRQIIDLKKEFYDAFFETKHLFRWFQMFDVKNLRDYIFSELKTL